ncbi:universal stress protein [Arenibacter sp. TNZ]|jgi:nucleotide-binding universal stress UspA family protein|uniref:universal stress protein n=1 Tax=Arenibacter TaxID=178469 RepID=UPI000CD3EC7C|nr:MULTISPECIES: universal stress protein [Arenibacter]MCM4173298.1 universal stress protein [Arenibacter sp. TNZ]
MIKILLPTDFSDNARNAIDYTLNYFKDEKCLFYILHTFTPTFYRVDYMMGGPVNSAIPDKDVELAQEGLEKTLTDIKNNYPNKNHQFKTLSSFNILTDEIQEVTGREGIDLIAMGTQGATGAKEIFLGTRTVHVIRKASIPVLAIPCGYTFKAIHTIVFPTDYGTPYNMQVLGFIANMSKLLKAKLIVLNVKDDFVLNEHQQANKKALDVFLKPVNHCFEQVKGEIMPNALHLYVEKHRVGLLAIMNRKHSFLERLITRSTVDAIGYHSRIPFLVIPDTGISLPQKDKT